MGNCFLYKRGGGFGGAIPDIVKVAFGKVISLSDSKDAKLKGLRIFGKTTQNGPPSPNAPVPLESVGDGGSVGVTVCGKNLLKNILKTETYGGITYTISDDGTITLNGTSTGSWRNIQTSIYLEAGKTYTMSGVQKGGATNTYYVYLEDAEKIRYIDTGNGVTFTPKVSGTGYVCAVVSTGAVVSNVKIRQQLEISTVATEYEPYKEAQTLTLSTPNGLPGIPVSSGGNYTDSTGQQWVCDEVDFTRGKYVQRIGILNKDSGWSYYNNGNNDFAFLQPSKLGFSHNDFRGVNDINYVNRLNLKCNCLQAFSGGISLHAGTFSVTDYFYAKVDGLTSTADYVSWMAENDFRLQYIIETPIETPLSAEELAQYSALHTNYPNTTIYNDAGAGMQVKYTSIGG